MSQDEFRPQRFGKYLLLDFLVNGGMAQILRARFLGERADKLVAIKMVRQKFSQDDEFKKMFEDELKVTFPLQHPHIAQTYDYGEVDGKLFVAMEYVHGRNLKQYLDELKKQNKHFPLTHAVYSMAQACQALHYAHNFTDSLSGKPINIVHRDISPHNIMLTFDGITKVIDFGIAKSDSSNDATTVGTIKGKVSYIAPEYIEGQKLDGRYDMFAIGLTLWELLTGQKVFDGANDMAILQKVARCQIQAPSEINPAVPKALDTIVLKALSSQRDERYKDMNEFSQVLTKFIYAHSPDFDTSKVALFAQDVFREEIDQDKKKMLELSQIDITPFLDELKRLERGEELNSHGNVVELNAHDKGDESKTKTKTSFYGNLALSSGGGSGSIGSQGESGRSGKRIVRRRKVRRG